MDPVRTGTVKTSEQVIALPLRLRAYAKGTGTSTEPTLAKEMVTPVREPRTPPLADRGCPLRPSTSGRSYEADHWGRCQRLRTGNPQPTGIRQGSRFGSAAGRARKPPKREVPGRPCALDLADGLSFLIVPQREPSGDIDHFCVGVEDFEPQQVASAICEAGLDNVLRVGSGNVSRRDPEGIRVQFSWPDRGGYESRRLLDEGPPGGPTAAIEASRRGPEKSRRC